MKEDKKMNNILRLAICDDDAYIIEQIEKYISDIKYVKIDYEVFFSAEELLQYDNINNGNFDLYILDVKMKNMSGLALAKILRRTMPYALFVFLSNYSRYVFDVFEVVTFDYIIKPLTFDCFDKLIHKVINYIKITKTNFVFSYQKNSFSIPCQNIIYIRKSGRKAFIHTNNNKIYQCNITLEEIWEQLDSRMFSSIYISCIVNLSEIVEILRDKLILKNGEELYIARDYRKEIKRQHLRFLKERI